MSPRRHYRRLDDGRPALDPVQLLRGVEAVQTWSDGQWRVRNIPGDAAVKTYRCPGCDQEIRPGVAHIVSWPADERGDLGDRRHWHTGCWRARDRRGPSAKRARTRRDTTRRDKVGRADGGRDNAE